MNVYYAYIIGPDGHIISRVDLAFEKQEDAVERAKGLVNGHAVELWQLDQKIATFKNTIKPSPGLSSFMKHRGIQYSVVQTANPTGWRWAVNLPGQRKPKAGTSPHREMAIRQAKVAIDNAIKVRTAKSA